jgi:hypothetical protein
MLTAAYSMFNRRHFLKHMAGLSLMAFPAFRFLQGIQAFAKELKKDNKSLIILWMSGGPPTIDLWDMKPGQPTAVYHRRRPPARPGADAHRALPEPDRELSLPRLFGEQPTHR